MINTKRFSTDHTKASLSFIFMSIPASLFKTHGRKMKERFEICSSIDL